MGSRDDDCGPSCCLCSLIRLLFSLAFSLAVAAFVFWLVFRPTPVKVHADSASLSRFNLTGAGGLLAYNLTLAVSIRNPNRRLSFYYDRLDATASYAGWRFGFDPGLPTFYQGHKNTTVVRPAFGGRQAAPDLGGGSSGVAGTFEREKGEGFFYVEVELHARVRVKVRFVRVGHFKPRYKCLLKLPAPGNGAGSFERTECDVDV